MRDLYTQVLSGFLLAIMLNKAVDFILSVDSPEIRELIFQKVGGIRVGNDEVTVEIRNV